MKILRYLLPLLLIPSIVVAETGGDLNLQNKASLVARDGYNLNLGTEGDDDVVVIQNNTTTMTIDGATGLVSFPVGFGGNIIGTSNVTIQVDSDAQRIFTFGAEGDDDVWLSALAAATSFGTFSIHPATADADDDQALTFCGGGGPGIACASDGRGAWFQLEGKEFGGRFIVHTSDDPSSDIDLRTADDFFIRTLAGGNYLRVINNGGVLFNPRADDQRIFTFDASSDTEHTMTFGDGGTTALQILSIIGSTADGDDDSEICLSGGGACADVTRGAFLELTGNDKVSIPGYVVLSTGNATSSSDIAIRSVDDILFQHVTGPTTTVTIDAPTGNISTAGTILSTITTNIGWSVQSAANQACNTTCVNGAVFGQDTGTNAIVGPGDATADVCVCAGAS